MSNRASDRHGSKTALSYANNTRLYDAFGLTGDHPQTHSSALIRVHPWLIQCPICGQIS